MHVVAVLLCVVSARSSEDPFARYFSRVEPRAPVQGSTSARYFADLRDAPARSPSPPAQPDGADAPPAAMLAELPKTGLWAPRASDPAPEPSPHVSASRLWQKQALPSGRGPIAGAEALWTGRPPVQGAWGGRAVEQPEQTTALTSFAGAPSPELAPFAMSVPQPAAEAADVVPASLPKPFVLAPSAPSPAPALPAPQSAPAPSPPAAAGALWRGEPPQAGLWQQQASPPKVPSKPTDLTVDPGWLAFPRGEQPKAALVEKQGNLRGLAAGPPADDPAEDQDGMLSGATPAGASTAAAGPAGAGAVAQPSAYNASQYSMPADERVPLSHRVRNLDRGESILKRLSAITQKLHEMRHGDKDEPAPAPVDTPVDADALPPAPALPVVAAQVPAPVSSGPPASVVSAGDKFQPPVAPAHPPKENVSAPPRSLVRHDLWDAHAFPTAAPTPAPVAPSPLLPPPVSVEEVKAAVESAAAKKASAGGSGSNATAETKTASDPKIKTAQAGVAKVKPASSAAEAANAPSAQAAVGRVQQFHRQQSDATDQLAAALTGTSRDTRVEALFKAQPVPAAATAATAAKAPAPPSPPQAPAQPHAPAATPAPGPMGNEQASVESQLAAAENIQAGDADDDWLEAIEGVAGG